jgi:two-component system nitrate/nitrite response regulator NarL
LDRRLLQPVGERFINDPLIMRPMHAHEVGAGSLFRGMDIVVADAQELVADGIRFRLASDPSIRVAGHVPSGAALLHWLRSNSADLVLMDVSMPAMDGIDTMRALRTQHPGLKVLAHSALVDIEYVNSMLIEGARGYLVKGGPQQELVEAIALVMDGGRYISPAARDSVARGYRHCDKRIDGEYLGLSQRERDIIRLIALERTNDEIGMELHISTDTVKTHRKKLMTKLNVRSTAGLVRYAVDRCWV